VETLQNMIEWAVLIVLPFAVLFQNFVHEAGHLLVGYLQEGREPLDIVIWPHRHKGRWYWARALMGHPKRGEHPSRLVHIIPFWTSLAICIITGILFFVIPCCNLCVVPSFVAALATILYFWYCYFFSRNSFTDGWRYRHGIKK